VSFEDFAKFDIRICRVLAAEEVKGSRKLVKLTIDTGTSNKTLVAGIAESHRPETIVGKTIVVLTNLLSKKIMGIDSQGMLLAAEDEKGGVYLLTAEGMPPAGTRVH